MPVTLAFFLVTFQFGGVFIFHSNVGAEEFILHESELTDHDGWICRQSDCVRPTAGPNTEVGANVSVFVRSGFEKISENGLRFHWNLALAVIWTPITTLP